MTAEARFRDTLKSLLAAFGPPDPTRRQKARQVIRDTLAVNQKSWNDLVATLQFRGQHSDKLKKLFAMLGQDNDGEFDNARRKISDLLARERRTWKAFIDSLFSTSSNAWADWHDHAASDPAINPLDLVHHLLWRHVEMTTHQFVAVSLRIAHTFVHQLFTVAPRLMVTSPVRGCGKTTLLDLLEAMCVRPLKSDSITAASIYHAVDREHPTLLIDEADNLGLAFNGSLRAVLNSGHRRGGKVIRYHGGQAPLILDVCAGRGGRHRHTAAAGHAPLDRDPYGAAARTRSRSARPTRRWTGYWSARRGSRTAWRGGIWKMAVWCSTT
jgi:hypothetical protein